MFNPKKGSFDQFLKNSWIIQWLIVYQRGTKELSGPDTRPVRIGIKFSKFLGPGPVRDFQILLGPGPILPWNSRKIPVLIRVDYKFPKKNSGPGPIRRDWSGSGSNQTWTIRSVHPCSQFQI